MYLLYFLLWVIFNGQITLEICLFGIVIAAALFAFTCKFMGYSVKQEKRNLRLFFKYVRYCFVLIEEIVKANLTVARMILSEKEELEPALVSFRTRLQTEPVRAFLANAITLTPGTITVSLAEDAYVVHCLDEGLAEGLDDSVIVDLLEDIEQS